jgi:3-isopropylmalate/(R)-2-methylmalate dehydratase large subunit
VGLAGALPAGVEAKDLVLRIIGDIGSDGAFYQSVEFLSPNGDGFEAMTVADRMTICNMAIEMGGKNGYFRPDAKTWAWLGVEGAALEAARAAEVHPDPDAVYARTLDYEAADLVPLVSCPPDVTTWRPRSKGRSAGPVLIGTCTNGG